MKINRVCVVGNGFMGRQIAMNIAMSGFETWCFDPIEDTMVDAKQWSDSYLEGRVAKGKITAEEFATISANLHWSISLEEAAKDSDLVIEAILEDEEQKSNLFKKLDTIVKENTIIGTNSSKMVSSKFVDCVSNPSRLCNIHYFSPAVVMKLVEIVQGEHTSAETIEAVVEFIEKTGKHPVLMHKEIDGFIVNRIVKAIQNEAWFLVEEGYCSYQDLDCAVELGLNHPLGPFHFQDFVGLKLGLLQKEAIYQKTGEKPRGYDTVKALVDQGKTGRGSGEGFYKYD